MRAAHARARLAGDLPVAAEQAVGLRVPHSLPDRAAGLRRGTSRRSSCATAGSSPARTRSERVGRTPRRRSSPRSSPAARSPTSRANTRIIRSTCSIATRSRAPAQSRIPCSSAVSTGTRPCTRIGCCCGCYGACPDWPLRGGSKLARRCVHADTLLVEARYLEGHPSFERPYGLAWLMLLIAEAAPTRWREPLAPLAAAARANVLRWLGALRYAVRSGTHNQTAFALSLLFDAAAALEDAELEERGAPQSARAIPRRSRGAARLRAVRRGFLSPALMEADLMQRLIPQREFVGWLQRFLPGIPLTARRSLAPVRRSRRRDRRQMGASARPESVAGVEPAQYRGALAA